MLWSDPVLTVSMFALFAFGLLTLRGKTGVHAWLISSGLGGSFSLVEPCVITSLITHRALRMSGGMGADSAP